jgi:hypothetical protein
MSQPQQQPQQHERSDAGAKVTVACKLPAGIIIRGFREVMEREAVLGGGTREFPVYRPTDKSHEINGTATPYGKAPKCQIVAGFALTPNVDKGLFDNWFDANKESRMVKDNLIFAYESADRVHGRARENEKVLTGFEMIDPDDPGKKVRGIAKADKK